MSASLKSSLASLVLLQLVVMPDGLDTDGAYLPSSPSIAASQAPTGLSAQSASFTQTSVLLMVVFIESSSPHPGQSTTRCYESSVCGDAILSYQSKASVGKPRQCGAVFCDGHISASIQLQASQRQTVSKG